MGHIRHAQVITIIESTEDMGGGLYARMAGGSRRKQSTCYSSYIPHKEALELLAAPLAAVLLLEIIDHTPRDARQGFRVIQIGWDLCVLAAGAVPGVFGSPHLVGWAKETRLLSAFFGYTVCIGFGAIIAKIKAMPSWSILNVGSAVLLGGGAFTGLVYLVW